MVTDMIPELIHEHMYDLLNNSNKSNNEYERQSRVNAYRNPVTKCQGGNQTTKTINTETTVVGEVVHQTGRNSTFATQSKLNADTAREEETPKICADR